MKNMKILSIMGSPHNGNTHNKIQEIERKLTKYNDVDFESIILKDMDLKPCKGCFLCFIKGENSCPLNDDLKKIF